LVRILSLFGLLILLLVVGSDTALGA
jgi:hypothetical protein